MLVRRIPRNKHIKIPRGEYTFEEVFNLLYMGDKEELFNRAWLETVVRRLTWVDLYITNTCDSYLHSSIPVTNESVTHLGQL